MSEKVDPQSSDQGESLRQRVPDAKATSDGSSQEKSETVQQSIGFFEGFAGTVNGRLFRSPLWVDTTKPPGMTSQESVIKQWTFMDFVRKWATGSNIFFSPIFIWLSFALIDYFVFPYDLESAKVFAIDWISYRFFANFVLTFGYVGFWHVTLHILGFGHRPFNPDRTYRLSKVTHNCFYNVLGVFQWTMWEALFMHCYATGRLPYITDTELFGSWSGLAIFALHWVLVGLWRDLHFYFAHRLIHIKFLYKYVHSLHHRNTDIEPFAGLSMHPIEHLYYFACAGPALYFKASPFALMWFGMHLLISPAASHSGFEDNLQSDQFHYLHHRYFECNYGSTGVPYDSWFGTFRESLDPNSKTYKGGHVESKKGDFGKNAALADAKANLIGLPKWDEAVYNIITYVLFPAIICNAVMGNSMGWSPVALGFLNDPRILGLMMSVGPMLVGIVLVALTSRRPFANPRFTFLYPFQKEKLFGAFGLNVLISLTVSVLPVYHMIHMLTSEPGQGIYFSLYGSR